MNPRGEPRVTHRPCNLPTHSQDAPGPCKHRLKEPGPLWVEGAAWGWEGQQCPSGMPGRRKWPSQSMDQPNGALGVSGFATYWTQVSGICTLQVWGLGKVEVSSSDRLSQELKGDTALPTNQVWPLGVSERERALSRPVEWPLLPLAL